jgi:hypothetical protein
MGSICTIPVLISVVVVMNKTGVIILVIRSRLNATISFNSVPRIGVRNGTSDPMRNYLKSVRRRRNPTNL